MTGSGRAPPLPHAIRSRRERNLLPEWHSSRRQRSSRRRSCCLRADLAAASLPVTSACAWSSGGCPERRPVQPARLAECAGRCHPAAPEPHGRRWLPRRIVGHRISRQQRRRALRRAASRCHAAQRHRGLRELAPPIRDRVSVASERNGRRHRAAAGQAGPTHDPSGALNPQGRLPLPFSRKHGV